MATLTTETRNKMRKAALRAWAGDPTRRKKQSVRSRKFMRRLWTSPEFKRKRRVVMKKYWRDSEWRCAVSRKIKQAQADPKVRLRKSVDALRAWARRPKLRTEASKRATRMLRRLWADPTYRKKRLPQLRENLNRYWTDPGNRRRELVLTRKRLSERWSKPKEKRKFITMMKNLQADKSYRDKVSKIKSNDAKRLWADQGYRERQIKSILEGRKLRPTGAETSLRQLLQRLYPGEFRCNGNNAGIVLGGYVPDFINVNGRKQVVELFGCYWHCCKSCGHMNRENRRRDDKIRLKKLGDLGWKSLIVWEHELKDAGLPAKIRGFVDG